MPETAKHRFMIPSASGALGGRGTAAGGVAVAGTVWELGRCGGDFGWGIGGGESGDIGRFFKGGNLFGEGGGLGNDGCEIEKSNGGVKVEGRGGDCPMAPDRSGMEEPYYFSCSIEEGD